MTGGPDVDPASRSAPPVEVGVVVPARLADLLVDALRAEVPGLLDGRFPDVRWSVDVVVDGEAVTGASLDVLEAGRDRMLDAGWDLTVVVTELPLGDGRTTVLSRASPVHRVGLVSAPALGPLRLRHGAAQAVAESVATLLGEDARPPRGAPGGRRGLARRLRQMSTDTPDGPDVTTVEVATRVLGGKVRLLLGMVRANRPWRLALGLSRALTGAAATSVLALVTPDLWILSTGYGPGRLWLLAVLAVGAVSVTLVAGGGLWERARHRRERAHVMLFNLATATTVVLGVVVLYAALLLLSLLGALLLVEAGVFADAVGRPLGVREYLHLAWLTASLATVGGALGAGLETDDAVREAAYLQRGSSGG